MNTNEHWQKHHRIMLSRKEDDIERMQKLDYYVTVVQWELIEHLCFYSGIIYGDDSLETRRTSA